MSNIKQQAKPKSPQQTRQTTQQNAKKTTEEETKAKTKKKIRGVSDRASFIDHIQRVEAYINGASLADVEKDELPEHLKDEEAASFAAMIWDSSKKP